MLRRQDGGQLFRATRLLLTTRPGSLLQMSLRCLPASGCSLAVSCAHVKLYCGVLDLYAAGGAARKRLSIPSSGCPPGHTGWNSILYTGTGPLGCGRGGWGTSGSVRTSLPCLRGERGKRAAAVFGRQRPALGFFPSVRRRGEVLALFGSKGPGRGWTPALARAARRGFGGWPPLRLPLPSARFWALPSAKGPGRRSGRRQLEFDDMARMQPQPGGDLETGDVSARRGSFPPVRSF